MSCRIPQPVKDYLDLIDQHAEEMCEWQHKLKAMILRIFNEETLSFDVQQIEKYLSYQKYFPFDLFDWEKFCFVLHNCVFREDGYPRFPDLKIIVGRGAGKNGYLSFEDFCLITDTHGIENYDVDIYATSEDQAMTSFKEIYQVLEKHKQKLQRFFYWNKVVITNLKTKSSIRYRTRNADTKDGGRPGKNDFDEEHAYQNWELIDVANTGLGKIDHPRTTVITTQGDVREGPLDDDLKTCKDILDGKQPDNGTLPFLCMLDDKKEIHDERKWNKANPSLRYRPQLLEQMRKEYQQYLKHHETSRAFVVKRMNLVEENKETAVTSWENILSTNRPLPDLTGHSCICGIDYAKTSDFVAAGLLFKQDGMRYWISHAWFCNQSKDKSRIKPNLKAWEEMGILTIIDDVEIHPQIITDWIKEKRKTYNITKIVMDDFRYTLFSSYLKLIGFDAKDKERMKRIRHSDIMKVVPVIDSHFNNQIIVWGDDPFMRWCTNNVKLVPAGKGNYLYDKQEEKSRKTDGFMAFAAAETCDDELVEYRKRKPLGVISL